MLKMFPQVLMWIYLLVKSGNNSLNFPQAGLALVIAPWVQPPAKLIDPPK